MCGLVGLWLPPGSAQVRDLRQSAVAMASALRHRGPDDDGVWLDPEAGVAMAHQRLAIVDLSPAGHQPMASGSGRYWIAFNGEIYNHHAPGTYTQLRAHETTTNIADAVGCL